MTVLTKNIIGKRVTLLSTTDQYTRLKAGSQGTITNYKESTDPDLHDVVNVIWDSGSCLSLLVGVDSFRIHDLVDDFTQSMREYLSAGLKLVTAWEMLGSRFPDDRDDRAREFYEKVEKVDFPFAMSFDEYIAEMWNIYYELTEQGKGDK